MGFHFFLPDLSVSVVESAKKKKKKKDNLKLSALHLQKLNKALSWWCTSRRKINERFEQTHKKGFCDLFF